MLITCRTFPHCFLWIGALFLLTTSCITSGENTDGKTIFRMNIAAGLTSLDPAFASSESNVWMTSQIFNGLVEFDSLLKLKPAIATRWESMDSGKVYRFFLRSNVCFHPDSVFGAKQTRTVTAQDFVYSFTRICDPAVASPGLWVYQTTIEGVSDFRDGKAKTVSGFRAINDSVFEIRLSKPFPPILSLLTMPYGFAVPKEAVEKYGKAFRRRPIGTGAFRFKSWLEGRQLVLLKNPDYFEVGFPKVDAIQTRFIGSKLTAYAEFLRGNLDFIDGLDPTFRDDLIDAEGKLLPKHNGRFQFLTSPQLTTEYYGMMTEPAPDNPFSNPKVRLAVHHAIDKAKLARFLLRNMGSPATAGLTPMGMPGFDSSKVHSPEFNLNKARQLLAEAGFPNGSGFPVVTLNSSPGYQPMSEFIQKSLEEIGLTVRIENNEGAAQREIIYKAQSKFWRASWMADYPDAENYLALLYSPNKAPDGPNTTRFSDPKIDRLYAKALSIPNDSARQTIYRQIDQQAMDASPLIPLYYYRSVRLAQNRVRRPPRSAMNLILPLKYVELN